MAFFEYLEIFARWSARRLRLRNDSVTGALVQDPSLANHMRIEIERPLLQLRQWHGQNKKRMGMLTDDLQYFRASIKKIPFNKKV